MREIVERLFENRKRYLLEESKLIGVNLKKDNSLGVSLLTIKFDTKDANKGLYDYIIDDTYPNAPVLKKNLLDRLNSLTDNQREYPYVNAIIKNTPLDFLRPGNNPMR